MKISSLQKGLVAHWTMSQDSLKGSLLADKTPYENDGIINGATFTTDRMGQPNKAMSLNGNDIDISSFSDIGTTHTISMWLKASTDIYLDERYLFDASDGRILLGWGSDTKGKIGLYDGTWRIFGDTPSHNVWHLVTFTMSGTTSKCKMFLDGVQYGTELDYTPRQINGTIKLGSRYAAIQITYYWNGSISDVRIYNRALSEPEIKTLYNSYNPKIIL